MNHNLHKQLKWKIIGGGAQIDGGVDALQAHWGGLTMAHGHDHVLVTAGLDGSVAAWPGGDLLSTDALNSFDADPLVAEGEPAHVSKEVRDGLESNLIIFARSGV